MEINEKNEIFERIKNYIIDKKYIALAISKNNEEERNKENELNDNNKLNDTKLTVPNYGYSIIDIKDKYNPGIIIRIKKNIVRRKKRKTY